MAIWEAQLLRFRIKYGVTAGYGLLRLPSVFSPYTDTGVEWPRND